MGRRGRVGRAGVGLRLLRRLRGRMRVLAVLLRRLVSLRRGTNEAPPGIPFAQATALRWVALMKAVSGGGVCSLSGLVGWARG